jgi:dUTP pyrophosphatase
MKIQALHPNFVLPTRGTEHAGGYDVSMPESGFLYGTIPGMIGLGFAAEVPAGHVALLLPRSSAGAKKGLELRNTCGVIDADYRGEWKACLRLKDGGELRWAAGEKLVQFIIVPISTPELELVDSVAATVRGEGGFGSTGK